MSSEPTAALTFEDLILATAIHLGVASYGEDGDQEAQIPTDVFDLAECKRHVNNAFRMFIADAPSQGWRWMRPILDVVLWPSVAVETAATDAWVTATAYGIGSKVTSGGESYVCLVVHTSGVFAADLAAGYWRETYDCTAAHNPATGLTTITANADLFYPSMEKRSITVTGQDTYVIDEYVSATEIRVVSTDFWVADATFSITSTGAYTLPATFGGSYLTDITYAAGSNLGQGIEWTNEITIRRYRTDSNTDTGYPFCAAIQRMTGNSRRWELVVFPTPNSVQTVQFKYDLYFNKMTKNADLHPAGFAHDETVKAACKAVTERDADDMPGGPLSSYYRQVCLPISYRADGRTAPRRLGYCGNPGAVRINHRNFRNYQRRPTVKYDTP